MLSFQRLTKAGEHLADPFANRQKALKFLFVEQADSIGQHQMCLDFHQRSPSDTQVIEEFLRVLPSLPLGDVRWNRRSRAPNLTGHPE